MSLNYVMQDDVTTSYYVIPAGGLGLSGHFQVRATTAIKDLAGNALTEDFMTSSGFTTRDISSWAFVDGDGPEGINRDFNRYAEFVNLTAFNNTLYVSWKERLFPAGEYHFRVKVFNGNDSAPAWYFVEGGDPMFGINYDASEDVGYGETFVFNSKLYAIWSETNVNYQVRVAVYSGNDASPNWTFVDGNGVYGINKDPTRGGNYPVLGMANSKLYAAWYEYNASTVFQIRISSYGGNDSSPVWTEIDGKVADSEGLNYDSANSAISPQLTGFNDKLYATWLENNSVYQVRVAVYNGNDASPSWTFVDGNGTNGLNYNMSDAASDPQLTVFNNKLYATWGEDSRIRVAVYNGNDSSPSWSFVDSANGLNYDSLATAGFPQLTVLNSKLYATWQENSQIRMAVYNGNDSASQWFFTEKDVIDSIGINKDSSKVASYPQIAAFGPRLFAAWREKDDSSVEQVRVAVGQ